MLYSAGFSKLQHHNFDYVLCIAMDNCITCSSLRCSSPDRSVQNVLQATQFSVFEIIYFFVINFTSRTWH
ncbi:MAG: hypothetical protein AABX07_00330 [Nanoarchaeota archaeon]